MADPDAGPPQYRIDSCSSCQAPIVWAVTERGKDMPVDAEPVDPKTGGGNITLTRVGGPRPLAKVHGNKAGLFGAKWVYRPHFATCPFAARHRARPTHRSRS